MELLKNKTPLLLLIISCFFGVSPSLAQPMTKNVKYFTMNGGCVFKTETNRWALADSVQRKPSNYLSEMGQDDSTIFLQFARGVADVKLNLLSKTVTYTEHYNQNKFSMDIKVTSWSEETITNGWTVNEVKTDHGSFYRTTGDKWVETDITGKERSFFTETKRDSASVFLLKDDGNQLKIDLNHKTTLFLNTQTGDMFELYKLTAWENSVKTTGFSIKSAHVGNYAFFNAGGGDWFFIDSAGNLNNKYVEQKRNDTSVILKNNDTVVVLDAKHKTVYLEVLNSKAKGVTFALTDWANEVPDNGFTTNQVHYGKAVFYSKLGGEWYHDGTKYVWASTRWVETDSLKKPMANFTEISRTMHSIVLKKDDGLILRMSLRDTMIYMQEANNIEQQLYQITKVGKERFVCGWTVDRVLYEGGMFYRKGSGKDWVEINKDGKEVGHFSETNRDEWSVYLLKNDGSKLQIDLYLKTTFFTPDGMGGKRFELYKLTSW
jgi:hypothetical protein